MEERKNLVDEIWALMDVLRMETEALVEMGDLYESMDDLRDLRDGIRKAIECRVPAEMVDDFLADLVA